jgi:hypothetical protein
VDPATIAVLGGLLVSIVVKVLSDKRARILEAALADSREHEIELELELYTARKALARHGLAAPKEVHSDQSEEMEAR